MSSAHMANTTQLFVRSNIHMANLDMALKRHLQMQKFVDVTLSCEGRKFRCHRLILAAASPLLERLFLDNPTLHPIVIMPLDIKAWTLQALIEFMYTGHVRVSQCGLRDLVRSAEMLQITGLENARKEFGINYSGATGNRSNATTKSVPSGKARRRNITTIGKNTISGSVAGVDAVICSNGGAFADLEDVDSVTSVPVDNTADHKINSCQRYGRAHNASGLSRDASDDGDDMVVRSQAVNKIRVKSSEILLQAYNDKEAHSTVTDKNTGNCRGMHRKLVSAIPVRRLKIPYNSEIIIRENQQLLQSNAHKVALRRQRQRQMLCNERPTFENKLRAPELQIEVEGVPQLTPFQQMEATHSENTAAPQLTNIPLDIMHMKTELGSSRTPTPTSTSMPPLLAVENIVCQPNMSFMYNGGSSDCSSPDFQTIDDAVSTHEVATGEIGGATTARHIAGDSGAFVTGTDYTKGEQTAIVENNIHAANAIELPLYRFPSYAAGGDSCVSTTEVAIAQVELNDKWPTSLRPRPTRYSNFAQPEHYQREKASHKMWPAETLLYANNNKHLSASVTAKYNKLLRLAKVANYNSSSHTLALSKDGHSSTPNNTTDAILSNSYQDDHADADHDAAVDGKVITFVTPPPTSYSSANGIGALVEAAAAVGLEPSVETVVLRSPRTNQPRNYSTQALYNALMAVKHGESIYRASREHHVPRKTLRNWMKRWNIKSQYPMPKQLKEAAIRKKTIIDISTHATPN